MPAALTRTNVRYRNSDKFPLFHGHAYQKVISNQADSADNVVALSSNRLDSLLLK